MKKMVKGCAMAVIVASMTMFIGCSKARKYECILEEMCKMGVDLMELELEKHIEFQVKEFKKLSKDDQEKKLKAAEEELEEVKKKFKKTKKELKEADSEEDLRKIRWR